MDKTTIITSKAQESSEFLYHLGKGPRRNGGGFGRIGLNSKGRYNVTKVGYLGFSKFTLRSFEEELVLGKDGEHKSEVDEVVTPGLAIDQYVVEKDKNTTAEMITEDEVHTCLER